MVSPKVTREIITRTRRELTLDEIEQALRDQFDLHQQDDIEFHWDARQEYVHGVEIIHIERTFEDA